jgi:hypothetical protein
MLFKLLQLSEYICPIIQNILDKNKTREYLVGKFNYLE